MERQKFEDSFREAFQKAEVSPSENVWTNIELDLERLDSGKMKRRIFFYKLVAAASVVFAMAIGGVGYYVLSTDDSSLNIASAKKEINSSPSTTELSTSESNTNRERNSSELDQVESAQSPVSIEKGSVNGGQALNENTFDSNTTQDRVAGHRASNDSQIPLENNLADLSASNEDALSNLGDPSKLSTHNDGSESLYPSRKLPALVRKRKYELYFPKTEPDEFDLMLAREEWKEKQNKKSSYEKVWTSVGFSAGSFNGGSSSAPGTSALSMASSGLQTYSVSNTLSNEASASGVSYSVGVNVGTRLSKRWILQGGLNYLTQNSNYTSDALITSDFENYSVANSAEIAKLSDANSTARVVPASPYNVNNSLQFLSVPIQAGYVLLNRAFAIQLNGGVSTDLFLQNTITPENGSLDKVSTGRGEDSPYRPVNFSGLMGTEFSYRFADRYRLALTPGIRYPFSSIYKSETGLQTNPITFDVGLRFRYIFQ